MLKLKIMLGSILYTPDKVYVCLREISAEEVVKELMREAKNI